MTPDELERAMVERETAICKSCPADDTCPLNGSYIQSSLEEEYGKQVVRYGVCSKGKRIKQAKKVARAMKYANIPGRYASKSWENYQVHKGNERAVNAARMIVDGDTHSLYLHGNAGTGKTFLAALLTQDLARNGKGAIFSAVPDLLDDIRRSYKTGEESNLIDLLRDAEILVLDDLGAERLTEWAAEQIYSLVNARYLADKQTIITSNLSPERLARGMTVANDRDGLMGDRLSSRILGLCFPVEIRGVDKRVG